MATNTITLNIKSQKATRQVMSGSELKEKFLYGIKIEKDGKELPLNVYEYWIEFAKKQVENYLTVKFDLQIITENKDFYYSDWVNWSQIKATYNIVCALSVSGFIGTTKQIEYPKEWLSVRKTSDNETYSRLLHIVPTAGTNFSQTAPVYSGFVSNLGLLGAGKRTPDYWSLKYITGFKQLPMNIHAAIGMLAAVNILTVGNETMAAALGVLGSSSKSISIDGLSQSSSMYINGQTGIFGARIKQYIQTLGDGTTAGLLKDLKDYYGAIIWSVC